MAGQRAFLLGLVLVFLGAGLSAPAEAQWKWRDKNGRITVSDLPPPREVPQQDILQRPDPADLQRAASPQASASAAAAAPKVDAELEARKNASEQAEVERLRADEERAAKGRAENCRNAKAHLAALNTGQRIARYNAAGEREILDDKQRASETHRARDVIASDCR